jgi:hypothetical protein
MTIQFKLFLLTIFVLTLLSCTTSGFKDVVKTPRKFILMPYPIFEDPLKGGPLFFLGLDKLHPPQPRMKREAASPGMISIKI